MAWYPGATRMELQPESDAQPAIRPTQLIVHSVVAPWDEKRIYAYWRDSTNLESHFGLDYDGSIGQYIGTETRADANAGANRRPDGTGAVSIETASNTQASDAWTPEQIEQLIRLGVWLHQRHGIPLRICRTHDDPGVGYHSMFPQWSTSGTACPGPARIKQFREVVFPGIVARAKAGSTPAPSTGTPAPSTPKETGMDLGDHVKLGSWLPARWPDDKGLTDKAITVNTALGSTYGYARAAAEDSAAILRQLEALRTEVAQLRAAVTKGA